MAKIIQTRRLNLIPLTLEQLQLFLTDLRQLEDDLDLPIDRDNTNATVLRAMSMKISKMVRLDPALHPWPTYWLLVVADQSIGAGMVGFKGVPDHNGESEIGYGISPVFRGNGYMTEAVAALIAWAFNHKQCRAVVALDVLRTNIASQRVLEKVGMHVYQETVDTLDWRIDKTAK
jgi:RimJ/RimL family protein N-acetyltransferase